VFYYLSASKIWLIRGVVLGLASCEGDYCYRMEQLFISLTYVNFLRQRGVTLPKGDGFLSLHVQATYACEFTFINISVVKHYEVVPTQESPSVL
jgi:hypothetical protein